MVKKKSITDFIVTAFLTESPAAYEGKYTFETSSISFNKNLL